MQQVPPVSEVVPMPFVNLTYARSKYDSLNIIAHASKLVGLGMNTSCIVYWMQDLLWSFKSCGSLVRHFLSLEM